MELLAATSNEGSATGVLASSLPTESEEDSEESDTDPGLAWAWRISDIVAQPTLVEVTPADRPELPRKEVPSLGQIFAELNMLAATIMSVPMEYTADGLVLSDSHWWAMNAAVCEGGLPLSIVRTVAEFEGLKWPTNAEEQKTMVKSVSRASSIAAMHGYIAFGPAQLNKISGRTMWVCLVVQTTEFRRPDSAVMASSMKRSTTVWDTGTFGARLWHFYSSRVCAGGLSAYLNAKEVMTANRAAGRVVDRMSFHHHSSYVVGVPPSRALSGVTESEDLKECDDTTMHVWTWLVIKNQTWQLDSSPDPSRVQMADTRLHSAHALARERGGDPYDVTVLMLVTMGCATEATPPLTPWGEAMCVNATMATGSKVVLLRGSDIPRVIVSLSDGRSVDVEIPKMFLMMGAEFAATGADPV